MFLNFGQLKTTADLTNGSHFSLLLAIGEKTILSTVNNYGTCMNVILDAAHRTISMYSS